ncbi:MAG: DUF1464 family protein, partial [Gemmatimonadota bacterium]
MPRVLGLDPGTVSLDCCGINDGRVYLEWTLPTAEALANPEQLLERLVEAGQPDLIAGPSGYGLPLIHGSDLTEHQIRLALLPDRRSPAGLGGLSGLMRLLAGSGLPVVFTPGVVHLPTVPEYRKLNRIDLGTADKVAAAALGIADQAVRRGCAPDQTSFVLLELGGAFSSVLAISDGQVVDGIGGTAGPMGWRSGGGWDGEVACLFEHVGKADLFRGGVESVMAAGLPRPAAYRAYIESAEKAVRQMLVNVPQPHEILVTGRHALDSEFAAGLGEKLSRLAPVRQLAGFAGTAKAGAQGAAVLADGLAGG